MRVHDRRRDGFAECKRVAVRNHIIRLIIALPCDPMDMLLLNAQLGKSYNRILNV